MTATIAIARVVAGALPSVLLVLAAFLIAALALALGSERRGYALQVMDRLLGLAVVVVGVDPTSDLRSSGRQL